MTASRRFLLVSAGWFGTACLLGATLASSDRIAKASEVESSHLAVHQEYVPFAGVTGQQKFVCDETGVIRYTLPVWPR